MFEGAYTAIVTPFNAAGNVDYAKLESLIERQVEGGIDGIVPVGTTGESPTLTYAEHKKVVEVAVRSCRNRIKVIAGTGGNSTSEALELTRCALDVGAHGTLQVTPYYNKPSQEGLLRHFSAIADLGLPVVLYNIPGRTGAEIALETVIKLAQHPQIVAIKEASGNVNRVSQILKACQICVLSGDDPLTLPMMIVGAQGVISVAANLAPAAVAKMVHAALNADWAQATQLHQKYFSLFTNMFLDTNPIPVKAALAMMQQIEEIYRLPLCSPSAAVKTELRKCLESFQLI